MCQRNLESIGEERQKLKRFDQKKRPSVSQEKVQLIFANAVLKNLF